MKDEIINIAPHILDITIDAHIDLNLNGWPASVSIASICLSGILLYGIKVWNEKNIQNAK